MKVTWREGITNIMKDNGDCWANFVASTFEGGGIDAKFDPGYGGATEGIPFTLWTQDYVYFPAVYDGSEWVASVPRNPNGVPTEHVGGFIMWKTHGRKT